MICIYVRQAVIAFSLRRSK